ncbi:MAG: hypothetical protein J5716_05295 [Alphaproteobacteria bacterium]|nr:hypothetical protein [Alphaproteobacteria bacterium]
MTRQNLKRVCFGLLLAISLAFSMTTPAFARLKPDSERMADQCKTWAGYMHEYQGDSNCWPCKIFMFLFDSINELAGKMNEALAGGMINLVVIGTVLMCLFHITMMFSNFVTGPDPMEMLSKLGSIIFRAGIGYIFLAGGASLAFDYIINPILITGAQLANTAANESGQVVSQYNADDAAGSVSGPMGEGVRAALKDMITGISNSMAQSQAIANGLRCGAPFWRKFGTDDIFPRWVVRLLFIPDFSISIFNPAMWAVGAWLGCIFWFIGILFTFAMIDVVFRIGLLVGMLPVFVAAWVFPLTASYAKSAWEMFINSIATFFVTGVMAAFIVILVNNAWGPSNGEFNGFLNKMHASSYVDAWDSLFDSSAGKGFITIFIVTIMSWYGICLAPKADGITNKILGGSFSSSCAIKALKKLIQFILDLIMMVFTIVTYSLGAISYVTKFFKYIQEAEDKIKKIKEFQDKIKKIKDKVEKIKKQVEKVKKAAEKVNNAIPDGDGAGYK